MSVPGLLGAFEIAPDGAARSLSADEAAGPADESWRWLHLDRNAAGVADWLRDRSGLPPRAVAALLAEDTRPRAAPLGEGMLVFLRGINLNEGAEPQDMVSARLYVAPGRIVSVTLRRLWALGDLRAQAEAGRGPETPGRFLAALAERLTERMEPTLDELEERLAALEDEAMAEDTPERPQMDPDDMSDALTRIRRVAIPLRRYLGPQRDAVAALTRTDRGVLDGADLESLAETGDRLTRMVEDLDLMRERSAALADQIASEASERMNRSMYLLSIVSALFLPLGFLTGLLGVNLGGLPGLESDWGFAGFCALLALVTGLEVWLIRRLRLI